VDPVIDDDDPYRDPELYDIEYADMSEDVAYYQAIAWQADGPILELGCGTGRLTIPMADTGAHMVGVDLSEAMLAGCRAKLDALPPAGTVELHHGEFRTFELGRRFNTIIWPFNALHHLRTDEALDQALQRIAAHLEPGGMLATDAYLPDLELYDRDPNQKFEGRTFLDPRTGGALESWEQGWWEPEGRIHHVLYTYRHPDGETEKVHICFRMWSLEELRAAFVRAGFTIEHEAEDFRSTPLRPKSLKYVATFRR
jgi:SAM-dependent methyltransferase